MCGCISQGRQQAIARIGTVDTILLKRTRPTHDTWKRTYQQVSERDYNTTVLIPDARLRAQCVSLQRQRGKRKGGNSCSAVGKVKRTAQCQRPGMFGANATTWCAAPSCSKRLKHTRICFTQISIRTHQMTCRRLDPSQPWYTVQHRQHDHESEDEAVVFLI